MCGPADGHVVSFKMIFSEVNDLHRLISVNGQSLVLISLAEWSP